MPYEVMATSRTPALIIYLLDISISMAQPFGGRPRIDVAMEALGAALRQMVFRSTRGKVVAPRYRIAMLAYSDGVWDLLGGVKTVQDVALLGKPPDLTPRRITNTKLGFEQVEKILGAEMPNLRGCPAPLVCHMTDGEYTEEDPKPVVDRLLKMSVPDGGVLIENIFISDKILPQPIADPHQWPGITRDTLVTNSYAERLKALSSPLPDTYRDMLYDNGYRLAQGCLMLLPGTSPELVALGFQMSAATPIR